VTIVIIFLCIACFVGGWYVGMRDEKKVSTRVLKRHVRELQRLREVM
jgi:hypothetical protein